MLKRRLSSRPHVCENALSEMPAKEVIGDAVRVGGVSTHRVKGSSIDPIMVKDEGNDLIVVL